jgi:hypothetical protein
MAHRQKDFKRQKTGERKQSQTEEKQSPLSEWDPDRWRSRCAWCGTLIGDIKDGFFIPVSLQDAAIKGFSPNSIQPLFLVSINKVVPMIITDKDSTIKKSCKDAYFQACCKKCAENLKRELQNSLTISKNG